MGIIYKITNIVNNKSYIGKTEFSLEQRFKEHIKHSKQIQSKNRPLYRAINKYGIENFKIEVIEERLSNLEEREMYYIDLFGTFNSDKGYNATLGGEGKRILDYDAILECYAKEQNMRIVAETVGCCSDSVKQVLNKYNVPIVNSYSKYEIDEELALEHYKKEKVISKVAQIMNCNTCAVKRALKNHNIEKTSLQEIAANKRGKTVLQYSLDDEYIATYSSTGQAAFLLFNDRNKRDGISRCARGETLTSYGFKWKYLV